VTAAVVLSVVSCGRDDKPANVAISTTGPSATGAASDKPTASGPSVPSGPVQASNEPVSFATADGVTIKGHLYAAPGPKRRVLVIASSLDQKTWQPYASQLAGQGVALLTYDMRGVGETGGARNDGQMDKDLAVAVGFVQSRDYPLVYVFAVGAEASAAAIKVAGREDLAGVAAYSASAAARADIAGVKEAKLLMAPESSADAAAAVNTLAQAGPEPTRRVVLSQAPSGNDPLSSAQARQALFDFVTGK
jgi:hypothetical protein